jgi:hypothetical protein
LKLIVSKFDYSATGEPVLQRDTWATTATTILAKILPLPRGHDARTAEEN